MFEDDDTEEISIAPCPVCDWNNSPMGTLGNTEWFRCRGCGIDYHVPNYGVEVN